MITTKDLENITALEGSQVMYVTVIENPQGGVEKVKIYFDFGHVLTLSDIGEQGWGIETD